MSAPTGTATTTRPTKPRVLVVEDDTVTFRMLQRLLEHYDFEVESAGTVHDALANIRRREPEFILLDLTLPDGCGSTVLECVRDRRMKTRVAIITGSADRQTIVRVARLGPQAVLVKPVSILKVLEVLKPAA